MLVQEAVTGPAQVGGVLSGVVAFPAPPLVVHVGGDGNPATLAASS